MDKLKMTTKNLADEKFERLKDFFPNAITETIDENGDLVRAIDKDILEQEISNTVVEGRDERYQFTWPDKKKAVLNANAPIAKTLRPCREESLNFDQTENLYIEGDNLEVLKLLQETYLGKIKMIYIDPPYNTGKDFVYNDSFKKSTKDYLEQSGQISDGGNRLGQNLESNGRFHTDWLNMIYPRLKLARNLLADDGVIFISIDDNEQANLKKICDEIFGENNFIANLIWKSKSGGANDSRFIAVDHEYILVYSKNSDELIINLDLEAEVTTVYNRKDENGEYALDRLDKQSIRYSKSLDYEIIDPEGKAYYPKHKDIKNPNATWRWSKETVKERYNELVFENGNVYTKNYKKKGSIPRSLLIEDRFGRTRTGKKNMNELFDSNIFSSPKPLSLLRFLTQISTSNNSTILDFFAGSSTTAEAIIEQNLKDGGNRKFIMVQLTEETDEKSEAYKAGYKNICEIGKERIRRAGKKILEDNKDKEGIDDLDIGFRVLKTDSSNMKDVYYKPEEISQNFLDAFEDNIKEDRSGEDLLFQVMLDLGISLSAKIDLENIGGKDVYIVDDGYLIACFDRDIDDDLVEKLAKKEPAFVVFRDSSMKSDSSLNNFDQIFQRLSPETTRRVI